MNNKTIVIILLVLLVTFGTMGCTQPETPPDVAVDTCNITVTYQEWTQDPNTTDCRQSDSGFGGRGINSSTSGMCYNCTCRATVHTFEGCFNNNIYPEDLMGKCEYLVGGNIGGGGCVLQINESPTPDVVVATYIPEPNPPGVTNNSIEIRINESYIGDINRTTWVGGGSNPAYNRWADTDANRTWVGGGSNPAYNSNISYVISPYGATSGVAIYVDVDWADTSSWGSTNDYTRS